MNLLLNVKLYVDDVICRENVNSIVSSFEKIKTIEFYV